MTIVVFNKVKAGLQDLLLGMGTAIQDRNGSSVTVNGIPLIATLETTTALAALDMSDAATQFQYAQTIGHLSKTDYMGARWFWDPAEPIASDNGNNIIAGAGVVVGCWKVLETNKHILYMGNTAGETVNLNGDRNFSIIKTGTGIYQFAHAYNFYLDVVVTPDLDGNAQDRMAYLYSSTLSSVQIKIAQDTGALVDSKFTVQISRRVT